MGFYHKMTDQKESLPKSRHKKSGDNRRAGKAGVCVQGSTGARACGREKVRTSVEEERLVANSGNG